MAKQYPSGINEWIELNATDKSHDAPQLAFFSLLFQQNSLLFDFVQTTPPSEQSH